MTNNNYTCLHDMKFCEQLNKICSNISPKHLTNRYFSLHFPQLFNSLVSRTKFLDDEVNGLYQITIRDRIFEVKGNNFFRTNESTGKEEMYCPYRYPDWTDDKYNWTCGLYEAKHQCMLRNNVVILRKYSIESLQQNMFVV